MPTYLPWFLAQTTTKLLATGLRQMDGQEQTAAHKRKGSPSEVDDEVQTKRAKVDNGDPSDAGANGHQKEGPECSQDAPSDPSADNSGSHGVKNEDGHEKHIDEPNGARPIAEEAGPPSKPLETRRPSASGQSRKIPSIEEEKKRGKRLFGGLLSTLSQTASTNHQQKRRLEIEKKQTERAQHRRAEDDKRRTERLEKLERVRKIEQVKFDEQVMKTRHSSLLATARSLRTKTRPRIYYMPWELTEEQQDIIKEQVQDAEGVIERETQEFRHSKERRLKDLGVSIAVGDPPPPLQEANKVPSSSSKTTHEKDNDEREDEMVQDREDDVLY